MRRLFVSAPGEKRGEGSSERHLGAGPASGHSSSGKRSAKRILLQSNAARALAAAFNLKLPTAPRDATKLLIHAPIYYSTPAGNAAAQRAARAAAGEALTHSLGQQRTDPEIVRGLSAPGGPAAGELLPGFGLRDVRGGNDGAVLLPKLSPAGGFAGATVFLVAGGMQKGKAIDLEQARATITIDDPRLGAAVAYWAEVGGTKQSNNYRFANFRAALHEALKRQLDENKPREASVLSADVHPIARPRAGLKGLGAEILQQQINQPAAVVGDYSSAALSLKTVDRGYAATAAIVAFSPATDTPGANPRALSTLAREAATQWLGAVRDTLSHGTRKQVRVLIPSADRLTNAALHNAIAAGLSSAAGGFEEIRASDSRAQQHPGFSVYEITVYAAD
ncbi:MAG: hypothetical protein IPL40_13590 [Proteobacteria bacterium]|nr:hypothetical protein [Pseudomonadota bacterium]